MCLLTNSLERGRREGGREGGRERGREKKEGERRRKERERRRKGAELSSVMTCANITRLYLEVTWTGSTVLIVTIILSFP